MQCGTTPFSECGMYCGLRAAAVELLGLAAVPRGTVFSAVLGSIQNLCESHRIGDDVLFRFPAS